MPTLKTITDKPRRWTTSRPHRKTVIRLRKRLGLLRRGRRSALGTIVALTEEPSPRHLLVTREVEVLPLLETTQTYVLEDLMVPPTSTPRHPLTQSEHRHPVPELFPRVDLQQALISALAIRKGPQNSPLTNRSSTDLWEVITRQTRALKTGSLTKHPKSPPLP